MTLSSGIGDSLHGAMWHVKSMVKILCKNVIKTAFHYFEQLKGVALSEKEKV